MANRFADDTIDTPIKKNRFDDDVAPASTPVAPGYTTDPVRTAYQATMNSLPVRAINKAFDIGGEAIGSVANLIPQRKKDEFSQLMDYFANKDKITSPVYTAGKEAVTEAKEYINDLANYNPKATVGPFADLQHDLPAFIQNAKLAGNIAISQPISAAITKANEAAHAKFVEKLVLPKETPSIKESRLPRTEEKGILKKAVYNPTEKEKEMAKNVAKLPVGKDKSYLANYKIIQAAKDKEAERLKSYLKQKNIGITPSDYSKLSHSMNEVVDKITENAYIGQQGKIPAERIKKLMAQAIEDTAKQEGHLSASSLLEARKRFDYLVEEERPKMYNMDAASTAAREATLKMRRAVNDFIESKVPDAGYKASLRKQNLFYDAMDNIGEKVITDQPNRISRFLSSPSGMALKYGAAGGVGVGAFDYALRKINQ
jgi:hypothetical protein